MERLDPCDNCLLKAMCSDVCYKKRWQMDSLFEAMNNNRRAIYSAPNKSSEMHYQRMFNFYKRRYYQARERERVILARRSNMGLSSEGSISSSSSPRSSSAGTRRVNTWLNSKIYP